VRALLNSVRIALSALGRSKLRTLLTALGILIGVAAVVVVIALGTGARERIGGQIESLGSNLIFVFGQSTAKSGLRPRAGSGASGLTDDDALAIRRESTAVLRVGTYSEIKPQVVSEFGNAKLGVMGVDADYFEVRNYEVLRGRGFTEHEERFKSKVVLIGQTATDKLFGNVDPIGRYVRIGKHPFRIIGTLKPKGQSTFEDQDDRLMMPIGSFRTRVSPTVGRRVQLIVVSARTAGHVPEAARQIEAILRQRHEIPDGAEADFRVRTQEEFRQSQDAIFGILSTLLLSVAGVSLFVGGVGVMNIMLVSVTERTREIGVRMAIGARRRDIQLQFLVESIALTLLGGIAGIAIATLVIEIMRRALEWSMRLSPQAVGVALVTSIAVGITFGFLPARRAAALDPIEALRHE
jgi:putative ABC transport system permease protein